MASRRELKKNVNYIAGELFTECLINSMFIPGTDKDKADGEAMDISHGIPFASPMKIYAGDYDDVADAAIIVITAGANRAM